MHSNASSSSQIGEVLAITLLNNATLEEGTLTNAKLQLISLAEARSKEENTSETVDVNKSSLSTIKELSENLSKALVKPNTSDPGFSAKKYRIRLYARIHALAKEFASTVKTITASDGKQSAGDSISALVLSQQKRCKLSLEDAVAVLGNLTLTSGSLAAMNAKEVENLISKNVQKALLAANAIPGHSTKKASKEKVSPKKSKNKPGTSSDKSPVSRKRPRDNSDEQCDEQVCFDCGQPDHKRGDDKCPRPSYLTMKIKAKRAKASASKDGSQRMKTEPFFRLGSNSETGNDA